MNTKRHNVFVSYHHANDQHYREQFEMLFNNVYDIIVSKSVQIGDIDTYLPAERVRQIIRDEYIRDATVTVVLIGTDTWKRKHVDWEIGASIRDTKLNPRTGLIGIFLPSYPLNSDNKFNKCTIPPRLYDNWKNGFAKLYNWNSDPNTVQQWIHDAFKNRNKINPDNSYNNFVNDRTSNGWC